jgi:C-terminal processing protease CtpA/Prc
MNNTMCSSKLINNQIFFSKICSLLRGGIAERGGVRVGHRIIEINNQSVVAVPHEKIVNLLATSVGEVSSLLIKLIC